MAIAVITGEKLAWPPKKTLGQLLSSIFLACGMSILTHLSQNDTGKSNKKNIHWTSSVVIDIPMGMTSVRQPAITVSMEDRSVRITIREIKELSQFIARREGLRFAHLDLAVVNASSITELNRIHLGHRGPTDVLSFDLSGGPVRGLSAQIIVCGEVAAKQGLLHGLSRIDELRLYIIHGLLHLMGYDDAADVRTAAKMHARQDELLAEWRRRRKR